MKPALVSQLRITQNASIIRNLRLSATVVLLGAVLCLAGVRAAREPSNERQWHPPQARMAAVTFQGEQVVIRDMRDFVYRSETDYDAHYVDRTYDLGKLDSVSYVISRFGSVPGLAHAFLTFGFGGEYVSVSVEARKEIGEVYSPLRGLMREYELMYVIGSERDVIGLRTNVWKEAVAVYPIRTSPENLRRVFLEVVSRAETLRQRPEFYDTLTNSCNSNIVRHVNAVAPGRVPSTIRAVLPGLSDRLAHELGLIDSTLPMEAIRRVYRVDEIARSVPLDEHFSTSIRRDFPRK